MGENSGSVYGLGECVIQGEKRIGDHEEKLKAGKPSLGLCSQHDYVRLHNISLGYARACSSRAETYARACSAHGTPSLEVLEHARLEHGSSVLCSCATLLQTVCERSPPGFKPGIEQIFFSFFFSLSL